jgi:DNA-binding response OmpR family regulator
MSTPVAPLVVLVVEDEQLLREMVEPALADAGYSVLLAHNGSEALKYLEERESEEAPLRALVTDVQLGPGPSGWEIAKRARELHPEIPVVYVTGAAAAEWSSKGVPNSLIIQKPFAPAQVVTAVSQLLNAPPTATPAA